MTDSNPILRMVGIDKAFSGVRALDGVDFDVRAGEVHALIGENGAGKSTLMNVLAGRFGDYQGRIVFDGQDVRITHPRQALGMGISVIYQELSVLGNFTVAENIMLGRERVGRLTRRIDRSFIRDEARKIIEHLQFDLDVDEAVAEMSTARQCLVEIASAVGRNVRVLVFDEPTAALGSEDVDGDDYGSEESDGSDCDDDDAAGPHPGGIAVWVRIVERDCGLIGIRAGLAADSQGALHQDPL